VLRERSVALLRKIKKERREIEQPNMKRKLKTGPEYFIMKAAPKNSTFGKDLDEKVDWRNGAYPPRKNNSLKNTMNENGTWNNSSKWANYGRDPKVNTNIVTIEEGKKRRKRVGVRGRDQRPLTPSAEGGETGRGLKREEFSIPSSAPGVKKITSKKDSKLRLAQKEGKQRQLTRRQTPPTEKERQGARGGR